MDVDLDDLYAAGEQQAAKRGAVLQAEVAEQSAVSAVTHEELLEQLRCARWQQLRCSCQVTAAAARSSFVFLSAVCLSQTVGCRP